MRLSNEIAGEPLAAALSPEEGSGPEEELEPGGSWAGLPGPWVARFSRAGEVRTREWGFVVVQVLWKSSWFKLLSPLALFL